MAPHPITRGGGGRVVVVVVGSGCVTTACGLLFSILVKVGDGWVRQRIRRTETIFDGILFHR